MIAKRDYFTLWYNQAGATAGAEPYYDFKSVNGKGYNRIYIDAVKFDTWDKFKAQKEIAINAYYTKKSVPLLGDVRAVGADDLYPLPYYLIERIKDDWIIWINALCPDNNEFERVKFIALQKESEMKEAIRQYGIQARFSCEFAPSTEYPSIRNHKSETDIFVDAFLSK